MARPVGTGLRGKPLYEGRAFDGQYVHIAFNLNQCKAGYARTSDYCYTVAAPESERRFGTPQAYVDQVLLEGPRFMTSEATLRRTRKRGKRDVFAWVAGTVRDPTKASVGRKLGKLDDWDPVTVCPFTDASFMIPRGRQGPCRPGAPAGSRPGTPIHSGKWAFFTIVGPRDDWQMRALVMPTGRLRRNRAGYDFPVRSEAQLERMAADFGGEIWL